ncbi:MAG: hypothetical protein NTX01_01105 [Candidatus Omnitrophica bacterium]|nr:hypothetical protein [Candidatus Omnitrophota bacterium]
MLRLKKTGQSTAEYAIVIGLVLAAVIGMQVYVKRGIQAKIKGYVDKKPMGVDGKESAMFVTDQYEPNYASSNMDTNRTANETIQTNEDGEVISTISADGEVTKRWGTQTTEAIP